MKRVHRCFVFCNQVLACFLAVTLAFGPWQYALAAPDDFVDDSAIYVGTPADRPPPNVLLIIDNSNATLNVASGSQYRPDYSYPGAHNNWDIYVGDNQGDFTAIQVSNSTYALEGLDAACPAVAEDKLHATGMYTASGMDIAPVIDNKGVCKTSPKGSVYALGNYLNYLEFQLTSDPDADGDGIADGSDLCPGHDDLPDRDHDLVPDGCDPCPGVAYEAASDKDDADSDTVLNCNDQCQGADDRIDADADGIIDCKDPEILIDTDGDGVLDPDDKCPGHDDTADLDGDGVANGCDRCPGFDDGVDGNGNGIPDGCEPPPGHDQDGDGVDDDRDLCPIPGPDENPANPSTDDTLDIDGDKIPDGCDLCRGDNALGDVDSNGICGDQTPPPPCNAPYSYVIVTIVDSKGKTQRYELTTSHTAGATNMPGTAGGGGFWAGPLGSNDKRTETGAWASGTCYVTSADYCKGTKPNKDGCVLLLPGGTAPAVVDGLPAPVMFLTSAFPGLAAGIGAFLALETALTAEVQAAAPIGVSGETQRKIIYDAVTQVVDGARGVVNFGAMSYGDNNSGGKVLYPLDNLSSDADFAAFKAPLPGPGPSDGEPVLSSQTGRPQAEALFDAGYYYGAQYQSVTNTERITDRGTVNNCGYNHIILITNGLSNGDGSPKLSVVGDADKDGYADEDTYGEGSHWADDIAYYLRHTATDSGGKKLNVKTHVVLAFQPSDPLLEHTAAMGDGKFYNAYDAQELADALKKLLISIVLEADTAFVAPVVPASTTNRTISSDRVYLGLFKPQIDAPWIGNIKKYRVGSGDQLADSQGNPATTADTGDFVTASRSYWGTFVDTDSVEKIYCLEGPRALVAGDGGIVSCGGVGGSLSARNLVTDPRTIYTYPPGSASKSLIHADNAWSTGNPKITEALLGVANPSDRQSLIRFITGFNPDSTVADAQRNWILGDVLHSKPLVFNYSAYAGSAENLCSEDVTAGESYNSSVIYVGANDGMLHAFRDCDGRELWSFIPPAILATLKDYKAGGHYYFVDAPPVAYVHDADGDSNIEAGDKVVLVFGLRRGGGSNDLTHAGTWGGYYALDVTNPLQPVLLWEATNQTGGLAMLGETWSQPRLAKVRVGGVTKVVAFVGGGYDRAEDLRYGATQTFPVSPDPTIPVQFNDGGLGSGSGETSSGNTTAENAIVRGRAMYAIEVAQLNLSAGVYSPDFNNSGTVVWSYDHTDNTDLDYAIPSDLTVLTDSGNYAKTIYVGDTGGRMWHFDVQGNDPAAWHGHVIFDANADTGSDVGRKIFYRPGVAIVGGVTMLWFGTGDRAHPLNHAVIDRMYMLMDRGQPAADPTDADDRIREANMVDMTGDPLQSASVTDDVKRETLCKLYGEGLYPGGCDPNYLNYGWYVKLNWDFDNGVESPVVGEKVLAQAVVFNGEVFYTTYAPDPDPNANDPCVAGNLGTSRLYHLDFFTSEAVFNYDTGNDVGYGSLAEGDRAKGQGFILRRSDRVRTLGEGIPSGIVTLIDASGRVTMMISASNRVDTYNAPDIKLISPVYWMQW